MRTDPGKRRELPGPGSRVHKKQAGAESRVPHSSPVTPVRSKMDFLDNKKRLLTGVGGQCPKEVGYLQPTELMSAG